MRTAKIAFIGAGSMCFGLTFFRDVFGSRELQGSTLTLVDLNADSLERMYQLALKMNQEAGTNMTIEKTTDRREALQGASFVVNSIAIERCELWKQDFQIPKKYGIRHALGENGGPGGLFFGMRTIPAIFDIVRDMEELCPDAYFINFSNPESRIILAVNMYSSIKAIGLCHGIYSGTKRMAKIMGKKADSIDVRAAGLNHLQWFLQIRDKQTGEDLYPLLREKDLTYDVSHQPLSRKLMRAFGYYPSCSDDHIGEYMAYGWEGGEHGYDFDADEKERVEMKTAIDERIAGRLPLKDWFTPSGEKAVHLIAGILHNRKTVLDSGVVYNRGAITNLPQNLAVEVPVMVDVHGFHPVTVGDLPAQLQKFLMVQAGVQQQSVEAAVRGSKELALQALLIDPVINSTDAAIHILDELWEVNKKYIRNCL